MTDTIPDDLMALAGNAEPEPEQEQQAPANNPPAPAPSPPSDGPLLSRLGVDVSRMLTFDFETGPDTERLDQISLEGVTRTPVEDCPAVEKFLADNKTVAAVSSALKALLPCGEWLDSLREAEESTEKPRKGVLDAIKELVKSEASLLKTLCITPRYAKITAFGWAIGNNEVEGRVVSHVEQPAMDCSEVEALEQFWDLIEQCHPLVGFNIKGFDLPLAFVRSAILGVRPTRRIKLNRYGNSDVIDLYADQGLTKGQCKDVAEDLGIEVPAGDMDGSRAWAVYNMNPEALRAYVRSDVEVERRMFWMLSGFFWD